MSPEYITGVALVAAAAIGGVAPTVAALGSWRASRKNASQESVDSLNKDVVYLHECFDRHTKSDEKNFKGINKALARIEVNTDAEPPDS